MILVGHRIYRTSIIPKRMKESELLYSLKRKEQQSTIKHQHHESNGEGDIEKQKDVYICFLNVEKAFDMVRHEVLLQRLRGLGIDVADLTLIANLYWGQRAVLKLVMIKVNA